MTFLDSEQGDSFERKRNELSRYEYLYSLGYAEETDRLLQHFLNFELSAW